MPTNAAYEFITTFLLVFLGCSAVILMGNKDNAAIIVALFVALGVSLVGISAQSNPAISLGMAINGKISYTKMFSFWIVQILGAICAAGLIVYFLGRESGVGATSGILTNSNPWGAVIVEAILTFIFVYTILFVSNSDKYKQYAGIIMGISLFFCFLIGYYITGSSFNPARSIGPAIFSGNLKTVWIYIIGPLIGGFLAPIVYMYINNNT